MKTWMSYNWIKLLALLMALGAIYAQFPYLYYQLTTWVILAAAFVSAQQAHQHDRSFLFWVYIATAVVFNPFQPLSFGSDQIWQVVYFGGVIVFFISLFALKPKR